MMQEEVIVTSLYISRMGERKHFQIHLPGDTKAIIGLEYGAIEISGAVIPVAPVTVGAFEVKADKPIGRLLLQVPGCEGVFFRGDLMEDNNYHMGDEVMAGSWQPHPWSHGGRKEELSIAVSSPAPFIEGYFMDRYGEGVYSSLEYQLQIYLWIEKNCA